MALQKARSVEVKTPLGEDTLLFRRMTATETIGRMFRFDLDLLSADEELAPADLLGQNVTVRLNLPEGGERFFNGFVSRFSQLGRHGNYAAYQATLRPWLFFLTRTSDCKIFQQKNVPDIVKEVFRDNGFTDIKDELTKDYSTWDYIVQYRETDFNFVSRLMEQEAFYYYFKHEDGKHTCVLTDGTHEPIPDYEQIPFFPPDTHQRRERDHIDDWMLTQQVQSGAYVITDYDFEKPKADMEVNRSNPQSHDKAAGEIFDFPGEYVETSDGDKYVQARLEELQAQFEHVEGHGNARGITTGALFELTGFPRGDQNREYLVLSTVHEIQSNEYESGDGEQYFSVNFTAMDSKIPFRLPRTTPKPIVQGPQTAVVVGKSGEEIFTDKYGRVKVQFHWDRYGQSDENSSCWVRVAQVWAGKQWGAIHIPRIGQEVIVEFLEGDPDRPIVTGRVYNADQMPPYGLPGNMTQSGIKSRSSKEGTPDNFNEIRFEDKKGEEQLFIHAEKNQDIEVENDETHWVGHDRTKTIDNDETTHVKHDRTETVDNNETITIHANRTETVDKDETITIHANRTETVDKNETITIHGAVAVTVDKNVSTTIKGARSEKVQKDETVSIDGNCTETIGKNRTQSVSDNETVDVGKVISVTAGDQISLTTGQASIVMKKDGTITIKGKDITIQGSGKITGKASKDIILKGSKILQN